MTPLLSYHKQEMSNLAKSAESRMMAWINTSASPTERAEREEEALAGNASLESVNVGEVMESVMEDDSGSDDAGNSKCNADVYQAQLDKIPENKPESESKRRALYQLLADENLRCGKIDEENAKEQTLLATMNVVIWDFQTRLSRGFVSGWLAGWLAVCLVVVCLISLLDFRDGSEYEIKNHLDDDYNTFVYSMDMHKLCSDFVAFMDQDCRTTEPL